ncbi:mannose-6-phosphate isomerase, class I [Miniimonas sp. S16]|uniref:mannose-6-phosphate isomerase, class I n=1 Tax=Miniimonas sp. S16 TaxID=2171623 RepID=UPI000D529AD4|nr:mannose-6-phosphate isomerase, class I [Miniimonas sp. S16]
MQPLVPALQHYAWGSSTALPALLGRGADGRPVAEAWFGAHPSAPSQLEDGRTLVQLVEDDPVGVLGADVVARLGRQLPYLLKIIAPASPLSLQVHPTAEQAALGYVREERAGTPLDAPQRTYRDANHKPEMVFALETFEAVSGFRAPRRALEVLSGLETPLIAKTVERLTHGSSAQGMRSAFEYVLLGARDRESDVSAVVDQIDRRLRSGQSPSEHSDRVALRLAEAFPGDRGVLASLLLNPVTLYPGEVMFVPAGCPHAYLSGLGVEIMASSDNVVRAGLTPKHIDARALLDIVDVRPAPPMRVAAERINGHVQVYFAPVEDFELAVLEPDHATIPVRGAGPRIVLALDGALELRAGEDELPVRPGSAVFLADGEDVWVSGSGRLIRASVP